MKMISKNVMPA